MKGDHPIRREELLMSGFPLLWLLLLFGVPTVLVFATAFRPADPFGGVGTGWTLRTLLELGNPNYPSILWRTLWLSTVATLFCLGLGVPMAYHMARVATRHRRTLLLLVIIPFWTNFLIRIFAWKVLLHPEGLLKQALTALHLAAADARLMYTPGAVLLVIVYTYLPFAILPLYAASEKFDFSLVEAARDLGASRLRAFFSVFLPGIRRGLATATLMVFIPALGSYVIPDVMGGAASEMLGNKIAQRVFVDRNLPHASALATLLCLAVLLPMALLHWHRRRRADGGNEP